MKNEFTPEAIKAVAEAGFDDVYGARPLKRAIRSKIEDSISEKLLDGSIKGGKTIKCDFKDNEFTFENDS